MSELFFSLAKSLICLVGTFNKKQKTNNTVPARETVSRARGRARGGKEERKEGYYLLFYYYRMCYFIGQDSKKERPRTKGRRRENSREAAKTIFESSCIQHDMLVLFMCTKDTYQSTTTYNTYQSGIE